MLLEIELCVIRSRAVPRGITSLPSDGSTESLVKAASPAAAGSTRSEEP